MHRRWGPLVVAVMCAACASGTRTVDPSGSSPSAAGGDTTHITSGGTTSDTDSAATVAGDTTTTASPTTTTTVAVELPTDAPCSLGAPPPNGQATFVAAGKLWARGPEGATTCLADLGDRTVTWLSWSPDGDEVLIGPDTVLRSDGTFATTGFFADNTDVRWSAPTGKALIAPKQTTGELIWRNADDSAERIDITFTDATSSAAHHPAGKHIVAAGIGRDGAGPGVFIASNRGANPQRLGVLEEGTTATEVAFEMSGDSVAFIHQHADGGAHVHRYWLTSGQLDTVAEFGDVTPTNLTASPVDQGDLAWTQSYSTVNSSTYVAVGGSSTAVAANDPSGDHLSRPVGWLPSHRLLVAARFAGTASESPFDLWEWSPTGMVQVIAGVTAAAARTVHGPYNELPLQLGSGFG